MTRSDFRHAPPCTANGADDTRKDFGNGRFRRNPRRSIRCRTTADDKRYHCNAAPLGRTVPGSKGSVISCNHKRTVADCRKGNRYDFLGMSSGLFSAALAPMTFIACWKRSYKTRPCSTDSISICIGKVSAAASKSKSTSVSKCGSYLVSRNGALSSPEKSGVKTQSSSMTSIASPLINGEVTALTACPPQCSRYAMASSVDMGFSSVLSVLSRAKPIRQQVCS